MEHIKQQIDKNCHYTAETLDELVFQDLEFTNKIKNGLTSMAKLKLFTSEEIKTVRDYAYHLLNTRYHNAKKHIIKSAKENFIFWN